MKRGDKLYFSPKYRFNEIGWDNKEDLIEAFRDRVQGFYLNPAKKLNEDQHAFGAGVLCATIIDFLGRITIGPKSAKKRIKEWLTDNIPNHFDEALAQDFYEKFRNGIVHEGRIKNCGQFSYDSNGLVHQDNGIMIVNPNLLLEEIINSFESYMTKVQTDDSTFRQFKDALMRDFQEDIKCAQT